MKQGLVYKKDLLAGLVWEDENGYTFQYDKDYLLDPVYGDVSRTLPLRSEPFTDKNMLPFFDGLIPEGWLLQIAEIVAAASFPVQVQSLIKAKLLHRYHNMVETFFSKIDGFSWHIPQLSRCPRIGLTKILEQYTYEVAIKVGKTFEQKHCKSKEVQAC